MPAISVLHVAGAIMSTTDQPKESPSEAPTKKKRRPVVAWQSLGACVAVVLYVAVEVLAVGRLLLAKQGSLPADQNVVWLVLTRPLVTTNAFARWAGYDYLFAVAQVVILAFGIGLGMAGIRRSKTTGRLVAAVALVYLGWIAINWYYQLIPPSWWPA